MKPLKAVVKITFRSMAFIDVKMGIICRFRLDYYLQQLTQS